MYTILANAVYFSTVFLIIVILLAIAASCEPLRYYVKFAFIIIATAIPASMHWPFMLLRIGDWRNALLLTWIVKTAVKLIGLRFEIRGKENIVKDSGSIVLINHQIVGELWHLLERCAAVVKKELIYYGTFGLAAWLSGTIFVDRENSKAQAKMNAIVKHIKDVKANVLIYPEGHRHSNFTLLPFKKGAFHLAIDTQLPIQPVIVSKYYFLNSKRKIFNSGTSYINILPAIPTKGLTKEDLPKLMEDTYRIMNKRFTETSQEAINEHINSFEDGK
nr:PREDICTED: 1-acyl-sn-glycerol-3-phosphate acyltransferase beta-like [Megachile rotundata]